MQVACGSERVGFKTAFVYMREMHDKDSRHPAPPYLSAWLGCRKEFVFTLVKAKTSILGLMIINRLY